MDRVASLCVHPLFADFSPEELEETIRRGEVRAYRPGEKIINIGDAGSFLGVVLEGTAQAQVRDAHGRETPLGEIHEGGYFGEISLVSGEPTTADVVAVTPCEILQIPHLVMSEALATHPGAMRHMAKTITERLRQRTHAEGPVTAPVAPAAVAGPEVARILVIMCRDEGLQYEYCDTGSEMNNVGGVIEGLGSDRAEHVSRSLRRQESAPVAPTLEGAARAIIERLTGGERPVLEDATQLSAVGHRVAHGGERYDRPVVIDDRVAGDIAQGAERICPDNRAALAAIRTFGDLLPDVPQVAVFDTAFFAGMPPRAFTYAVPYEWYETHGIRRYGRDGLVHQHAALSAAACLQRPVGQLNLLVCNLGPSSSVCAIRKGRAVDVSGGLTPLEGIPGATTSGDVDPGLAACAAGMLGVDIAQVQGALRRHSGLLGMSGASGSLEELSALAQSGDPRAALALDVLCYRLQKCLGAYMAVLGEPDAVVFTGPAGTHLADLRTRICGGLANLDLKLDEQLNLAVGADAREASDISEANAAPRILVVPTSESRMIAAGAAEAVGQGQVCGAILAGRRPIPIGISVHHVHLSREHVEALYGPGHQLTFRAPLSQPGQFACEETVDLMSPKGRVERVRVLGPERPATQVEVSRTECFSLGLKAPIRMSGVLEDTPGVCVEGPAGRVEIPEGVICAARHLHVSPEEALMLGLRDKDEISVHVEGERALVFGEVIVRVHPEYRLDMHIDTDEANAARLDQGAVGYIQSVDERA